MKRALWVAVGLLFIVGCAPPDPQTAFDEGESYFNQGLLDKAIAQYQVAVKYKPDYAAAWTSLGQAYFAAERYVEAAGATAKAIELQPEDTSLHMLLAIQQLMARKYAEGEQTLVTLLEGHPIYPVAELNLASARALQSGAMTHGCYQKLAEALGSGRSPTDLAMRPVYETIVVECPDFLVARFNLGMVQLQDRRMDEAKVLFEQVIQTDPGFAKAHRELGKLASRAGELKEAVAHYTAALEADPLLSDAHFEVGAIYCRMRGSRYRRSATEHLKTYLEQQPEGSWSIKARELLEKYGV